MLLGERCIPALWLQSTATKPSRFKRRQKQPGVQKTDQSSVGGGKCNAPFEGEMVCQKKPPIGCHATFDYGMSYVCVVMDESKECFIGCPLLLPLMCQPPYYKWKMARRHQEINNYITHMCIHICAQFFQNFMISVNSPHVSSASKMRLKSKDRNPS